MKVCNLGNDKLVKFCNLSPGTLFSTVGSDLNVDKTTIYMKLDTTETSPDNCVDVVNGRLNKAHSSARVVIYPNAALVLDYIDRS